MSNDSDSSSESSQSQIPSSTSDSDQNSALEQLQKKAPEGEFVAYINSEEAKMLKDAGGSGNLINGIPSFYSEGSEGGGRDNSGTSSSDSSESQAPDSVQGSGSNVGTSTASGPSSTSNVDGTDNEEADPANANTSTGGGYVSNQDFSQSQPDYNFRDDEDGYGGEYSEAEANYFDPGSISAGVDTSMDTTYSGGIDYNTADEESQRVISDLAEQGGYGTGAVGLKGWANNLRSNFLDNPAGFLLGTQTMLGRGLLALNATSTGISIQERISEYLSGVSDTVKTWGKDQSIFDNPNFNAGGGDSNSGNQSDFGDIISKEINTQLPDSVAGKYYAQQHGLLGKSVMDDYQKAKASINQTTQSAGILQQVATTSNPFFDFLEANNLNRGIL